MEFTLLTEAGATIAIAPENTELIAREQDALDIIAECGGKGARRILFHAANFAAPFYDLKTRLAGDVMQKFINYQMRFAVVVDPATLQGKFREMVIESNRGRDFGFFGHRDDALRWLARP